MAKSKTENIPTLNTKPLTEPDETLMESTIMQETTPLYKEDTNAFTTPIEENKDFITSMPSEILNEILTYTTLHHDPTRGAKEHALGPAFMELPHVLLSLAAMSRHFRDHVESFCLRELTRNKDAYRFKTDADLEVEVEKKGLRRSARLKGTSERKDFRCYRFELVKALRVTCLGCNGWAWRRALMANGVACCYGCEGKLYSTDKVTNLTNALERYDLRDWMLIPTRKPGPRAKQTNLPTINYATIRTPKPFQNGWMISYRFFKTDVARVAAAVHGDVEKHLAQRTQKRAERKTKKRDAEHRKLKIRYHQDALEGLMNRKTRKYHKERLEFYLDPKCDEGYAGEDEEDYGDYDDIHARLFGRCRCDSCEDAHEEEQWMKYCPWA